MVVAYHLEPSVLLAHEMIKKGIARPKIAFALCRVGESEGEIAKACDYIEQAGYQVLAGAIPEKIAFRRARDEGRALTETRFASLNEKADRLAQSIVNLVMKLAKGKEASYGENTPANQSEEGEGTSAPNHGSRRQPR